VGQLKSCLKCSTCGYESNTFDPIWDLSLPIKKSRSISNETSLYDCFDWFTQEEVMDGDEKPTCARCKQRRKCTKGFSIQKFPKVLIIHLKRFDQGSFRKLSTVIDFPLQELDLTKYSAEKSAARVLYNLYAVSNHSGTPFSGHYTASCKHPYSGEWHHYNDSRVSQISATRTKSSEAYVLFYELASQSSRL
jgi:ubiquitin carboxyl-terminal hydrolase 2/21